MAKPDANLRNKPKQTPNIDVAQPPQGPIDPEARHESIARAAYYKASQRNFQGDGELADWLEAEREFDSLATSAGIAGEASRRAEGPDDVSAPAIRASVQKDNDDPHIEPDAVKYWAGVLGVPEASVRLAIERVGTRVEDVRRYLGDQSATP